MKLRRQTLLTALLVAVCTLGAPIASQARSPDRPPGVAKQIHRDHYRYDRGDHRHYRPAPKWKHHDKRWHHDNRRYPPYWWYYPRSRHYLHNDYYWPYYDDGHWSLILRYDD